jgi:outer membrane receptor protein involved in Fe transport
LGTITSAEIAKQTIDNPLNALQGKVAGMLVTQTNGLPGSGTTIQIRGQGTMGYTGSIPLYVIG